MLEKVSKQSSFYDSDQVCDRLIPPDSFYRRFRELVVPLIKDDQFESMYCKDNGRPCIPPSLLVGNVTSLADDTSSAAPSPFWWTTYDYAGNRLDNVTDTTLRHYLFDENGNTTDDGMRTFVYDAGKRLLQVRQGSTVLVENEYDGKGRRAIKRANNGATVTVFHYDLSDRLIAETDGQGNLKVEYVYLEGRPLAQIRHTGSTEAAYYYHDDHLGTPRIMTSNTGTVVWRVETDPFGNEIGTPIKTIENNLRFPGQYFDQETGLHQNYFRTYDPTLGRYREADPIGIYFGENHLYVYAGNNPLRFSDYFGLHYLIDPFTGGYKPHRHDKNGMIDPFPGPGMLDPDPKDPNHNSWGNCIKCNGPALMACLGETANDIAGCVQCSTLPPGPAKVAACASCAAGSARAAICVFEHCQSGRQEPCSGECK